MARVRRVRVASDNGGQREVLCFVAHLIEPKEESQPQRKGAFIQTNPVNFTVNFPKTKWNPTARISSGFMYLNECRSNSYIFIHGHSTETLAIERKNSHHIEGLGLDLKRVLTAVLKNTSS